MWKQELQSESHVRFEVSMVVTWKIAVFWDVTLYSITDLCWGFTGTCCPNDCDCRRISNIRIYLSYHTVTSHMTVCLELHTLVGRLAAERQVWYMAQSLMYLAMVKACTYVTGTEKQNKQEQINMINLWNKIIGCSGSELLGRKIALVVEPHSLCSAEGLPANPSMAVCVLHFNVRYR